MAKHGIIRNTKQYVLNRTEHNVHVFAINDVE